ncbi:MAG TPA: hypothetical protein VI757_16435 [Bacteroidia bacterium]|nr:hypothetical protein [Bacteroidia bacterium]
MSTNQINIEFSPLQETAINNDFADIDTNFPFAVNLTKDERGSIANIDNERYPYAQRTMDIHAPNNPNLVTGFAGTYADAQRDWRLVNQCEGFKQKALMLIEKLNDTQHLSGSEVYKFMRQLYASAKLAAANNVPGADTIVDDLKTLFEGQGVELPPNP